MGCSRYIEGIFGLFEDFREVKYIFFEIILIYFISFLFYCILKFFVFFCYKIWGFFELVDFFIVYLGGVRFSFKGNIFRMIYFDGLDVFYYFLLIMEINFNFLLVSNVFL